MAARAQEARPVARVALLALAVAAGAVGCGRGVGPSTTPAAPGDPITAADIDGWTVGDEPPAGWTTAQPRLASLQVGADDRGLAVDVVTTPVRLADGSCGAGPPYVDVTDERDPQVIWIGVRALVPDGSADPALAAATEEHGPCPAVTTTVDVDLPAPLAGRDVVVDQQRWVPGADGPYAPCELPGCDPETGDGPATATCADGGRLVEDVRTTGDVPRHADIGETRCHDGWAMVEVDVGAGACPAGEEPNPCAGDRFDRLFLRAGSPHWEVLTRTRDAGCGGVAEVAPDYPTSLCEDRPAL